LPFKKKKASADGAQKGKKQREKEVFVHSTHGFSSKCAKWVRRTGREQILFLMGLGLMAISQPSCSTVEPRQEELASPPSDKKKEAPKAEAQSAKRGYRDSSGDEDSVALAGSSVAPCPQDDYAMQKEEEVSASASRASSCAASMEPHERNSQAPQ
jgi:hypothetical protein